MGTSPGSALRSVKTATLAPRTERDRRHRRIITLCAPFLVLAVVAAFVPLATMVRMSVSTDRFANVGVSLSAWETLVSDPLYRRVAWNTLWFAAATSVVSVTLGTAVATRSRSIRRATLQTRAHLCRVVSYCTPWNRRCVHDHRTAWQAGTSDKHGGVFQRPERQTCLHR